MITEWVEQKARELCETAGLDPDGLSYDGVVWPVPFWQAYVPMAYEVLRASMMDNHGNGEGSAGEETAAVKRLPSEA